MQDVDINDLASIGAVRDTPAHMLPPEALTIALNMRGVDGGLERLPGWTSIFGTPTVAPHFVMPISTVATNFWLYAGLTKIYGFDGTTHTNITRQTAAVDVNYTGTDGFTWQGTLLGGIPVLNNNSDVPQFWATPALATKMADLSNWPANNRAKIIRAFGVFLVAFGLNDNATLKPYLVRWSHPAVPGSVPASWDVTDTTKDTGEVDLADTAAGIILDALPLGSTMYIYKENSVHRMTYVGGRAIMDFGQGPWLPDIGILAARCVAATGDGSRHVWASQDDLLWHDGNKVRSLLTKRQRARLANEIDSISFASSFMFANPLHNEVWFCYPGSGQSFPDRALILNYAEGSDETWLVTEADGIAFRHAAAGLIENPSDETWDTGTDVWDSDTGPWSTLERRRIVLAGTAATKIYKMDSSQTRDGVNYNATVQRVSLAVTGRNRKTGEWIVDHHSIKQLDRLWPKVRGGPILVRVGTQETVEGSVLWSDYVTFDPATQRTADIFPCSGAAISVEFATTTATSWRVDGYKLEIEVIAEW